MKMMLMAGGNRRGGERMNYDTYRSNDYRNAGSRSEFEMRDRNERMNYGEMEGRFRGDGGRNDYGERLTYDTEMAQRRYRRDDRGRFLPRSEMDGDDYEMQSHYPMQPYVPPMHEKEREGRRPMNQIGFVSNTDREYGAYATHPRMNEMEYKSSQGMMMGHAQGKATKLTREMADEWMKGLQNEDGTKGPHWTFEQVKQVMAQKGVQAEPVEFWAVLNAVYADYCKVFKKYGLGDKLDAYVDMAKAFIDDKDASDGKVVKYFESVVKGW